MARMTIWKQLTIMGWVQRKHRGYSLRLLGEAQSLRIPTASKADTLATVEAFGRFQQGVMNPFATVQS